MFGSLLKPIENALTVGLKLVTLEAPTKREVAQLLSDGVEIAAIASAFGVAESVIMDLID